MAETIKMQFPANTKYIKAIRLATCTIASELEFNFDEIEDIRLCVAESCIMLLCKQKCDNILIEVTNDDCLGVVVCAKGIKSKNDDGKKECLDFNEEISRIIIESLTNSVVFDEKDGILEKITFIKKPVINQGA